MAKREPSARGAPAAAATADHRERAVEAANGREALLAALRQQRSRTAQQRRQAESARTESRRLAALDEARTRSLFLTAHELRAPLTALNGYLSMIEDGACGEPTAELRRILSLLIARVAHMGTVVDGLIEVARLEDDGLELSLRDLDLRRVVEQAIDAAAPLATPIHPLIVELPEERVPIRGDALRLRVIIANLVHNAVKYSPRGGEVRVTVASDGERARVVVADEGLGIDEADLPRLFTRFGRITTAENCHIEGAGLGLYLCEQLAHLHGGELGAASSPGQGSRFTLTLPLQPEARARRR